GPGDLAAARLFADQVAIDAHDREGRLQVVKDFGFPVARWSRGGSGLGFRLRSLGRLLRGLLRARRRRSPGRLERREKPRRREGGEKEGEEPRRLRQWLPAEKDERRDS